MKISDFLQQNHLRLFHSGHGMYDGEWPVLFAEMDRLDQDYDVTTVIDLRQSS